MDRSRVRKKRGGEPGYPQDNQLKCDETDKVACNRQGGEIHTGGHQAVRDSRASSKKRKDAGMEGEHHAGSGV